MLNKRYAKLEERILYTYLTVVIRKTIPDIMNGHQLLNGSASAKADLISSITTKLHRCVRSFAYMITKLHVSQQFFPPADYIPTFTAAVG